MGVGVHVIETLVFEIMSPNGIHLPIITPSCPTESCKNNSSHKRFKKDNVKAGKFCSECGGKIENKTIQVAISDIVNPMDIKRSLDNLTENDIDKLSCNIVTSNGKYLSFSYEPYSKYLGEAMTEGCIISCVEQKTDQISTFKDQYLDLIHFFENLNYEVNIKNACVVCS